MGLAERLVAEDDVEVTIRLCSDALRELKVAT
jgi:hypothetical protein